MVSDSVRYTVANHELLVLDGATGGVRWHGRPDDVPVSEAVALDGTNDALVLLDYASKRGAVQNLIRVKPDGSIQWRAELPTNQPIEAYVDVQLQEGDVIGQTWTGYSVVLDMDSGKILKSEFVK